VQLRDPQGEALTAAVEPSSGEIPQDSRRRDVEGHLRLDGEIARGGMGAILKGRDTSLGRDIAVKVLLEAHAGKTDLVQRFVEEAQIAGQLQHPGVTPVYELGRFTDQRPYFTMKLVKGQTLAGLLAARQDPAEERSRLVGIFEQVCQTLAYAHARGVIHRDLKPANVMVGAFGEVQVMDWGLAKVLGEGPATVGPKAPSPPDVSVIRTQRSGSSDSSEGGSHTQVGAMLGTPAYMAPEQACGEVDCIDERSDVFGLGAILCEILTGKPPYVGRSREQVQYLAVIGGLDDALARLNGCGADGELVGLAKQCLAAEPAQRPRHAGAVAEAVTAYQHSVVDRLHRAEVERAAQQVRAEEEAKQRVLSDQLASAAQARAEEEARRRRVTLALMASVLATVLLGAGVAAWYAQERQQRQARQDLALQEAELLRDQAAAAPEGAVARWQEARLAVEKASGVLGTAATGAAQARLETLQKEVEKGLAEAEADEQLAAQLERIRSTMEGQQADAAYAEAFRGAGLDLSAPETMSERLRTRPQMRAKMVGALDAWSVVSGEAAGEVGLKRVLTAARLLDPEDSWRNHLRDALERRDLESFRRLAAEKETLARQGPVSLWLLGHGLQRLGDRERALEVLQQGQRRYPGDYWLNLELGMALLGGKRTGAATDASSILLDNVSAKYQAAEPYLRAAVALRPLFAPAHDMLATALAGQRKWEEAIAAIRQAIALDPNYSMAHNDLGLFLANRGDLQEAVAEIHQALTLDPKNPDAGGNLSWGLQRQGKLDEALAACQQDIALHPKDPLRHSRLGWILRQQGKPGEAIAAFRQALQCNPRFEGSRYGLGLTLRDQGKLDEAVEVQREFTALDPKNASAHILLANALGAQAKRDEAVAAFRQAIALDPKHALAHHGLGSVLSAQGKQEQAVAEFRLAVALEPKNSSFRNSLANALRSQGRLVEALGVYHEAIAHDPKNAEAYNYLGLALTTQGNLDEAIATYRQALTLDPSSMVAQYWLRSALLQSGRGEEARAAWHKELERDPPEHAAWFGYAELCLFLGQHDEYHRARQALLGRFGATTDLLIAERTGRACLLLPASGDELRQATALIDRAIAASPFHPAYPFFLFAKGLAEYRHGRLDSAIATLRWIASRVLGPAPRLVMAMAQHQRGQKLQARKTLAAAILAFDWSAAGADNHDAWIYHVLRREAEALIVPNLPLP
jgi:serine/threonine-protein kinase